MTDCVGVLVLSYDSMGAHMNQSRPIFFSCITSISRGAVLGCFDDEIDESPGRIFYNSGLRTVNTARYQQSQRCDRIILGGWYR